MTVKRKTVKNIHNQQYWQTLLQNFTITTKIWLESFELKNPQTTKPCYQQRRLTLNPTLTLALKKLAKNLNIPVSSLLHSAFGLLLNRYSATNISYYATALSKKTLKLNYVAPILPVKSVLKENETFQNYINALHQQLQQSSQLSPSLPQPLDITSLNYLFLDSSLEFPKKVKKIALNEDINQFSLIFQPEIKTSIKLMIYYSNIKFSAESIKRFFNHYLHILSEILRDINQPVMHFSLLTPHEKRLILKSWSCPKSPLSPAQTQCAHDQFSHHAMHFPDNLAVTYLHKSLTYGELEKLSNQLAHYLIEKNLKRGDSIAVLMERTPTILITMLAIFKIGAIYVPVNTQYPDERIHFVIKDCNAKIIIVQNTERVPSEFIAKTLILDEDYGLLKSYNHLAVPLTVSLNDIAYIIYTSGTTGIPKGVMNRHAGLTNLIHWYQTQFAVTDIDRSSQFASQAFDTFFCETIPYLASGASIHIIDDNSKLTPSTLLAWLAQEKITVSDLPTAYAQILLTMTWPEKLALRLLKIGGESVTHYPNQLFSFDIWNGYGPTEATVETIYMQIYQANIPLAEQASKHMPPPIGKPITNTEVYLVDQNLQPIPVGIAGEILIGGAGLAAGYINRPELTQEKFITNPFDLKNESKLYRTGDLGRWLPDGTIEYIGRIDSQIKIRGYRIELSEIETTLSQFPDVGEIIVIAKKTQQEQKNLFAYLVPNLDRIRIPYQEKCLLTINEIKFYELITDDISKNGIALTGLTDNLPFDQIIRLHIKLPGMNDRYWFTGRLIWQHEQRAGIQFESTSAQKTILKKSIEYYLANNNLMDILESATAKRSLRKALKKKLPDYMIPSVFCVLPKFPLTFNGKIDIKALPHPKEAEKLFEKRFVGPNTPTERKIVVIWQELLQKNQISLTDNFFDLGGNSLLVSRLSLKIFQDFNISIPAKIFIDLPFISVLAEYIDSQGTQYSTISAVQEEIKHDTVLPEDILPSKNPNPNIKSPRGILLTGAGGFLGIYLLRELLTATDAKIYCLIRKGEFESAAKRLIETIHKFHLENEISLTNRRIIIITGDISFDKFGISAEQYNSLAEKIDVIYHCGAQVNTMASYSNLRNSNVQGTLEIIKFATQTINKSIHYISTLSAAYKLDANGNFAEEFPGNEENNLVGGYAITKWVSERLLTQIKNRGLTVSIYRSGYILGQSDTGITNLNDALLLLIKGCIQLGFAPAWEDKITLLPVDFVSQATIQISLAYPETSLVYHLDHPTGILWTDLISWLNNAGYSIKLCSHADWLKHLIQINQENALYHFLPNYLAEKHHLITPGTGMQNTLTALKKIQITFPKIEDPLLKIYLNYLCNVGFLPPPQEDFSKPRDSYAKYS